MILYSFNNSILCFPNSIVFISTTQPEEKMVKNYISLIELDVQGDKISVQPNLKTFKDEYKNEDHEENYDLEDVLDDTDE